MTVLPDRSVNLCPQSFENAKHSGHSFSIMIGFWMDSMSILQLVLYGIQEHMLHTGKLSTSIKCGSPIARRVCGLQSNPPKWTHQYHKTRPMHGQCMACNVAASCGRDQMKGQCCVVHRSRKLCQCSANLEVDLRA